MSPANAVRLVPFERQWLDELVLMWRRSFEAGVGIADPHPLREQADYFLDEVLPHHAVRVAMLDERLAGFVAASDDCVAQLYVRVGLQRAGIGTAMLDWAKRESAGSLWLYTFACNRGARAFYERNGFVAIAHGFEPTWRLEDIKYRWQAQNAAAVEEIPCSTT